MLFWFWPKNRPSPIWLIKLVSPSSSNLFGKSLQFSGQLEKALPLYALLLCSLAASPLSG
jgi:hypothetical protein